MEGLTRKDYEALLMEVSNERKTLLMQLKINESAQTMINEEMRKFPKDESKDKKDQKRKPSSYVG